MTTTAADLIAETRRHLHSGQAETANRLSGAVTSGATSLAFKYPLEGIAKGAVLGIGLEEIRVWETGGTQATVVERAVNGSTAAAHNDLDYVAVRPKFSDFRIFQALNEDLSDLSSPVNGLYQVKTVDVTYNSAIQGYDLTSVTDVINILEVRWKQSGPTRYWPLLRSWALGRNMATSEFASGLALFLYDSAFPGLPIHVRYSAPFTPMAATTDDMQATVGLPASANDLPPLGAAIRLVGPRDIKRTFTEAQYDPKRAEEVPPGAAFASTRSLQLLRQRRLQEEQARLMSDYPVLLSG